LIVATVLDDLPDFVINHEKPMGGTIPSVMGDDVGRNRFHSFTESQKAATQSWHALRDTRLCALTALRSTE
jgi:hypothetical protein